MSKLVNMVLRVAMWGALGAGVAMLGVWVAQNFFEGGVLGSGEDWAKVYSAGVLGAVVGGVIGFFRRN